MIPFSGNRLRQRRLADRITRAREKWAVRVLAVARVVTIGSAYIAVRDIPGLTSSFVAIFTALLTFDLMVAAPSLRPQHVDYAALWNRTWQALSQTVASLAKGLSVGLFFGSLTLTGFSDVLGAVLTVGLGYTWASRAGVSRRSSACWAACTSSSRSGRSRVSLGGVHHLTRRSGRVAGVVGYLTALLSGWILGIPFGIVTRLFLRRPYERAGAKPTTLP